jgi:hypothetical protein
VPIARVERLVVTISKDADTTGINLATTSMNSRFASPAVDQTLAVGPAPYSSIVYGKPL